MEWIRYKKEQPSPYKFILAYFPDLKCVRNVYWPNDEEIPLLGQKYVFVCWYNPLRKCFESEEAYFHHNPTHWMYIPEINKK